MSTSATEMLAYAAGGAIAIGLVALALVEGSGTPNRLPYRNNPTRRRARRKDRRHAKP